MSKYKRIGLLISVITILFLSGVGAYTIWNKLYADGFEKVKNKGKTEKETSKTSEATHSSNDVDLSKIKIDDYSSDEQINILVYKKVNPSVVNITTKVVRYTGLIEPFLKEGAAGSGSIIDKEGHILTNVHVIQAAAESGGRLYVTLWDKSKYSAKLIGVDPENDIALIKIDPKDETLQPIEIGNSDNILVGQKVLAIGNPFGFNGTLTTGIISSLGRTIKNDRTKAYIEKVIQIDAAINPGNSGGPLINAKGELVGVNTAIYSPIEGNIGIGFAIPINIVKGILEDLKKYGKVNRPKLASLGLQPQTFYFVNEIGGLKKALDLPFDGGIMIVDVVKNSPIAKLGLKGCTEAVLYGFYQVPVGGDVILEIEGKQIFEYSDVSLALRPLKIGDTIHLKVWREGKIKETEIKFAE